MGSDISHNQAAGGSPAGQSVKKGLILDVDGTLWDALEAITDSWNQYTDPLEDVDRRITYEQMAGCLGKTMFTIADILFGYLPTERRREVLRGAMKYENEYLWTHPGKVYPGVKDTLEQLRAEGWHLYIVSNCQKGYIETFLHAADADGLIEDHICFEDTMQEKAENIRLCSARNRLDRAFYVGDTEGDLEASRNAGVPFIFAGYGFGSVDERDADGVIGQFAQLKDVLAQCDRG